jgi:Tfp pilus assembly protein PilF
LHSKKAKDTDAEQAFQEALSWDHNCAEALVGLAHSSQRKGTPRQTLVLLRQAVAAAPEMCSRAASWRGH